MFLYQNRSNTNPTGYISDWSCHTVNVIQLSYSCHISVITWQSLGHHWLRCLGGLSYSLSVDSLHFERILCSCLQTSHLYSANKSLHPLNISLLIVDRLLTWWVTWAQLSRLLPKLLPLLVRAVLGGRLGGRRRRSSSHHWSIFHFPLVLSCLPTHLFSITFITCCVFNPLFPLMSLSEIVYCQCCVYCTGARRVLVPHVSLYSLFLSVLWSMLREHSLKDSI